MISFLSNSNDFKVTIAGYPTADPNYDGIVYKAGQTMLRLERLDQQTLTGFIVTVIGTPPFQLSLYTDPDGVLEIPLKNIINSKGTAMSLSVTMFDVSDLSTLDYMYAKKLQIFDGVDEREANIPIKEANDVFGVLPPTIMPPNVIFNPTMVRGSSALGIIVEAGIQNTGVGYVWTEYAAGVGTTITPSGGRTNQLEINANSDTLSLVNGAKSKNWKLDKADRCTDMLCVRWKSLTGATRQHYFPVTAYNIGTDKSVSLVTVGDGYETLKNHFNGVTCRITGLTPYGYWYYADLLRASEVYAVLQSSTIPWVPVSQEAAYVETDGASVNPDANGFLSFEFTIKLKHYGTF